MVGIRRRSIRRCLSYGLLIVMIGGLLSAFQRGNKKQHLAPKSPIRIRAKSNWMAGNNSRQTPVTPVAISAVSTAKPQTKDQQSHGYYTVFCNSRNLPGETVGRQRMEWIQAQHQKAASSLDRGPCEPPGNTSRLILDLSHWGTYPWIWETITSQLRQLEQSAISSRSAPDRWCLFPIREWASLLCRYYAPTLCSGRPQGWLPCSVFHRASIRGEGELGKKHWKSYRISRNFMDITDAVAVIFNGFGFLPLWLDRDRQDAKEGRMLSSWSHSFWSDLLHPRLRYQKLQTWVMSAVGESASYYPHVEDVQFLRHWDLTWGYDRRWFHLHAPCYFPSTFQSFLSKGSDVPFHQKRTVIWLGTHCGAVNKRDYYVRKLSRYISIDSLGECETMYDSQPINSKERKRYLNGRQQGRQAQRWATEKRNLIAKYKFVLAFENSNCFDYVTEKILDPWMVGVVPVYMGAPNILDYAPSNNSLIRVDQFKTPQHLAHFLNKVAKDEQLYNRYLEWRQRSHHDLKRTPLYRAWKLAKQAESRAWTQIEKQIEAAQYIQ